jgi:hypothetical protein
MVKGKVLSQLPREVPGRSTRDGSTSHTSLPKPQPQAFALRVDCSCPSALKFELTSAPTDETMTESQLDIHGEIRPGFS